MINESIPTSREIRIGEMLGEGMTLQEIAARLPEDYRTTKARVARLARKLGIEANSKHTRIMIAIYWNCELFQIGLQEITARTEAQLCAA